MSLVQEKVKKLQRTRNLRLPRERMFRGNRQALRRPLQGSSGLRSGGKGSKAPVLGRQTLIGQRRRRLVRQGQLRQVGQLASKMCRPTPEPRRRNRLRSKCNRSNRNTRTSVRSQSRSRFRRLPTTRIIGFKEPNAGRVRNTKYFARIIRNGTIRAGITRISIVWS